uniref:serine O-acetyltransferase n=1 Tax=Amphora coffeiformis TaxID=265554 RepID=A0A7S3KZ49_9STRA
MSVAVASTATAAATMCNGLTMNSPQDFVDPVDWSDLDDLSRQLRQEAIQTWHDEPELGPLLRNTVLAPGVRTFEDAVACTVAYRLLSKPCPQTPPASFASNAAPADIPTFCPSSLRGIISEALHNNLLREAGHSASEAVRLDALAVCDRDPAVDTVLEVVLFLKGFAALVCHRAAYYKWHAHKQKNAKKKSLTALWLQSQASSIFGLDIHPAATIGAGVLFDHGTGIVIGETATVGDGCTMLHGVTLGGTGKDIGDRHPKVGANVLIGANASLLGNISIGDGAKIGAGSVVLRPIPAHATAVGSPAKIVGRARESNPGSTMDETLQNVQLMRKSASSATLETVASTNTDGTSPVTQLTAYDENSSTDDVDQSSSSSSGSEGEDGEAESSLETKDRTTKHKHDKKKKDKGTSSTDAFCPFRDYIRLAKNAPPDSITFCTLKSLLQPEGCPLYQIGEIMFTLDTRNVGYVKPEAFLTNEAKQIIVEKTKWPLERVTAVLEKFRDKWHNATSNKARQPHAVQSSLIPVSG